VSLVLLLRIVVLNSIFFSMMSCGIDSIVYLNDNPVLTSTDDSTSIFKGPESNNSSYLGVEIFYRIYYSLSDADADKSTISTKQDVDESIPGSVINEYLINPNGLKYKNLVLVNIQDSSLQRRIPTILSTEIPDSSYFVSIEFPSASNEEPFITITNEVANEKTLHLLLKRNSGIANDYLRFIDEPKVGDPDFKANTNSTTPGTYYVQLYAASYGLNFVDFSELYGDAVFIGRIILNF